MLRLYLWHSGIQFASSLMASFLLIFKKHFLSPPHIHHSVSSCSCLSAGDAVPDVGSSSVFHYQAPLVEVSEHVVHLLRHHSVHLLPCDSQATGLHHTEVNPKLRLVCENLIYGG